MTQQQTVEHEVREGARRMMREGKSFNQFSMWAHGYADQRLSDSWLASRITIEAWAGLLREGE